MQIIASAGDEGVEAAQAPFELRTENVLQMYKHILLPTDGSSISEEAAAAGIDIARAFGARVTALHVIPDPVLPGLESWAHHDAGFAERLSQVLEKRGTLYLETVRDAARRAGVPCECQLARDTSPHAGIIAAARDGDCDLIVMASHGRRGSDGALLGSETVKAATLGTVPVLVHRKRHGVKRAGSDSAGVDARQLPPGRPA
jgi:nucleotide-binding universal stress UspA family protein